MFLLICSFTITIFKALLESRIECFRFHPLSVADNLSDMKWQSRVEEYRVVGKQDTILFGRRARRQSKAFTRAWLK